MFTLRRISSQGVSMNFALGAEYTSINRFESYEEFSKAFKHYFGKPHIADLDETSDKDTQKVFCFISNEGGSKIFPLYMNQHNYIMSENGKTFSSMNQHYIKK